MRAGSSRTARAGRPGVALRGLRIAYVVAAAAIGVLLLVQAVPKIEAAFVAPPTDLSVDLATARAFMDHYSPFTPAGAIRSGVAVWGASGNGHPPTTSFWALPLVELEPRTASAVLAWVTVFLLIIELGATLTTLGCPAPLVTAWLATTFIIGCTFMTKAHFAAGQLSGAIGFLYFLAWRAARRGAAGRAGIALGAACSMKLFPGVVVLLFVATGRWRAVVGAAASYLAIAAIMTSRFGLQSWPQFFARQSDVARAWMDSIENQSIHAVVLHLFRPVCVGHGPILPAAMVISVGLSAALVGLAMWWARRSPPDAVAFDRVFAMFVVVSVVTSQWTWEHYAIIYALPIAILGAAVVEAWRARATRWSAAIGAAALFAIVASWRIDLLTKIHLQKAFLAGDRRSHLALHLYDVANWGPGIALLALLAVVVAKRAQAQGGMRSARARSPHYDEPVAAMQAAAAVSGLPPRQQQR